MESVLICRTCGTRATMELATNEQELANVGMLERRCGRCGAVTTWGHVQDYRHRERRTADRRRSERRGGAPHTAHPGGERRSRGERRVGRIRKAQRRSRG